MSRVQWDRDGRAWWHYFSYEPCPNPQHHPPYRDEYGHLRFCPGRCDSKGMIHHPRRFRLPQWDAIQPPTGWTPQGEVDSKLALIYGLED